MVMEMGMVGERLKWKREEEDDDDDDEEEDK
jgi:hypothetical protein